MKGTAWHFVTPYPIPSGFPCLFVPHQVRTEGGLRITVALLTLSNLAFLPAIVLAWRWGLYYESMLFVMTMLTSIFYHLCDERVLCVMLDGGTAPHHRAPPSPPLCNSGELSLGAEGNFSLGYTRTAAVLVPPLCGAIAPPPFGENRHDIWGGCFKGGGGWFCLAFGVGVQV